jgi:hypothetical protein
MAAEREWILGRSSEQETTLWQRKAKPSAIGESRRKADGQLWHQMPVIMLRLAMSAVHESVRRGRRSRR